MANFKNVDASSGKLRSTYIAILIPLGVAINLIGGQVAGALKLPLFMDSIGTAIVAAIMGPWIGAVSGVLFNVIASIINGNIMASLFGLCNICTAVIVGYMVRAGKFQSLLGAIITSLLVAIANAILGAPIAVVVYGGIQGGGVDLFTAGFLALGNDILSAAFLARIPANLADKGIAVFAAWLILKRLPDHLKSLSGAKKEV
ncbi:ECF transporter S component [Clostridiales bacterium COT073_COT-073]|nr:ECF transporter S component [Clostridiales bacterium COT073_COT-073]